MHSLNAWQTNRKGRLQGGYRNSFIVHLFLHQRNKHCYVSVKLKLQHPPPPQGNPPGIWLFWKLLFKLPPTWAKMPFTCLTLGSIQVIKCPHPGDVSQAHKWQKDGRNALSCQNKSLYKYANNLHSIWQKLRNSVSVFTTNKSFMQSDGNRCYKVTECSAFLRVSCL